jgi:hypothetical protein
LGSGRWSTTVLRENKKTTEQHGKRYEIQNAIPDGPDKTNGEAVGSAAAADIIALRAGDGSSPNVSGIHYSFDNQQGQHIGDKVAAYVLSYGPHPVH